MEPPRPNGRARRLAEAALVSHDDAHATGEPLGAVRDACRLADVLLENFNMTHAAAVNAIAKRLALHYPHLSGASEAPER